MIILILLLIVVLLLIKQLQQIFKQIGWGGLKKEQQMAFNINYLIHQDYTLHLVTKFGKKLDLPSTSAEGDSTAVVSQSTNDITLLGGVSTTNDQYSRTYVVLAFGKLMVEHLALIMMVQ